ncbi:hypothetical protein L598_000700000130 [Mesorhizobium sp. J18]|nr:hypothetical protein L598_000700000130 [Mesorhizobium sp. J18]
MMIVGAQALPCRSDRLKRGRLWGSRSPIESPIASSGTAVIKDKRPSMGGISDTTTILFAVDYTPWYGAG